MPGVLVKDIVASVIKELSQVPGIATQIYSAPIITQFVQNAFLMEINELWWPQYMFYQVVGLDGTNGFITADLKGPLSFVDDFSDIQHVFPEGSNRKLRELPQSINPYSMQDGGRGAYITPDMTFEHRPFRVVPVGSTGNVVVRARQTATTPFSDNTRVYLDQLLLTYDSAWMYAVDDGTVPAQVNKFQMLAVKRRNQLKAGFAQHPLELDPRLPPAPIESDWFVLDQDPLA